MLACSSPVTFSIVVLCLQLCVLKFAHSLFSCKFKTEVPVACNAVNDGIAKAKTAAVLIKEC